MTDEIQSGLSRCDDLTAGNVLFKKLKPDVLILGKALSGGMIPMSCILANNEHMSVFNPGSHGSTFGGNPLPCAISIEALNIIQDECIPNVKNQERFIKDFFVSSFTNVKSIRGVGMFWGIQFDEKYNIEDLRFRLINKGYITFTSRNNTLRLTPPLTIQQNILEKSLETITPTKKKNETNKNLFIYSITMF